MTSLSTRYPQRHPRRTRGSKGHNNPFRDTMAMIASCLCLASATPFRAIAEVSPESLGGDCDNNGVVDLKDVAGFVLAADTVPCPSTGNCHCYDINDDGCVNLRDFATLQVAFGAAQDTSGPPPSNIFVLQLADYHEQCGRADGDDRLCQFGDPCCEDQVGHPGAVCNALGGLWIEACDTNADRMRDHSADLDTLAEWNDFFWEPDDACNLLAREHYPQGSTNGPYARHFLPMCPDGSTPPKGTTVCPDGQPIIQCTDGTRPVFFYRPGTVDRWIIKVQDGGDTCSIFGGRDCWIDVDRWHFSSAWGANGTTTSRQGLYDAETSPAFADYHMIIIGKCVGDRNCGSRTVPMAEFFDFNGAFMGQGPVYFHGYRILQALLARLTHWNSGARLTHTSQISFSARSNGSNGLYMYIDRLAEFIRHDPSDGRPGLGLTGADVRGLPSAYIRSSVEAENLVNEPSQNIFTWNGFGLQVFDDHIKAPLSTSEPEDANGRWYSPLVYHDGREFILHRDWGTVVSDMESPTSAEEIVDVATLDESCFRAHGLHGGDGVNVEACFDSMHVLMNHVTTPLFLAPQLYDPAVRTSTASYTEVTDSFETLGFTPDPGSLCGSHDENFICTEQASCPEDALACDQDYLKPVGYNAIDFALRVRAIARGAVDRSSGMPEENPADVQAPVSHAVFAPEWESHDSWATAEKINYRFCDDIDPNGCAWQSAPLWAALKSWLELDATVICVERDLPGVDPNRPLTAWSETTPGPLLDERCGIPP